MEPTRFRGAHPVLGVRDRGVHPRREPASLTLASFRARLRLMTTPIARIVMTILASSTLALSNEWPQFRGPGGLGTGKARDLPATWSDEENVVWKAPLPGAGASSPIALGDKLYLTSYSGYGRDVETKGDMKDLRLHLVCVSAKDGK